MNALLNNYPFGKQLILYVLVISLARGIFVPDFRYAMVSIVLIQLIYPVALFAPLVMKLQGEYYWSYYFLCIGGIVVAGLAAALRRFFEIGIESMTGDLNFAMWAFSIVVQIGLYSVLVILLFMTTKGK